MNESSEQSRPGSKLRKITQIIAGLLFVMSAGISAASYKTQTGLWVVWALLALGFAGGLILVGTRKLTVLVLVGVVTVVSVVGVNTSSVSDGVNPIWSAEHKRQKWIVEAKNDLRSLSTVDPLLPSNNLDAWARLGSLEEAVKNSAAMTQKYAQQVDSGKIDATLVEAGKSMVLAASATKVAAEAKIADLKTGDDSSNSKAAKAYDDYVTALVNADTQLAEVSNESK